MKLFHLNWYIAGPRLSSCANVKIPFKLFPVPHIIMKQRVDFKVTMLVHRWRSGISPSYLADDCCLATDACEWQLRSTVNRTCVVMWTYSTFGICSCWTWTIKVYRQTQDSICTLTHSLPSWRPRYSSLMTTSSTLPRCNTKSTHQLHSTELNSVTKSTSNHQNSEFY